jgi:hypothetical protein
MALAGERWRGLRAVAAVVLLGAVLIAAIDSLAWDAVPAVTHFEDSVLTPPGPSAWEAAASKGLTLTSKSLQIAIRGDELTATYTVTAPAGSPLGTRAETDDDPNTGNDLVDNVLGHVTVAEFRYGFTGQNRTPADLTFEPPTLTIAATPTSHKKLIDTLTVRSDQFRLYRSRQQVAVRSPNSTDGTPAPLIQVSGPGAEVSVPVQVAVHDSGGGSVDLVPAKGFDGSAPVTFTLSEGRSGQSWVEKLRAIGGISIPIAGTTLNRLDNLFVYAVVLWSLAAARRRLAERGTDDGGVIEVTQQSVAVIITAFAAVAVIGLAEDVASPLLPPTAYGLEAAATAAGPLALLLGGTIMVWPLACWRRNRDQHARGQAAAPAMASGHGVLASRLFRFLPWMLSLLVTAGYWLFLNGSGINPGSHPDVIVGMGAVLLAAPLLVRRACGGSDLATSLVSAGCVAACFAGTLIPGLLQYPVNPYGKWTYLIAAVAAVAGLCVLCGRATQVMFRRYRERLVATRLKNRPGKVSERLDRRLRVMSRTAITAVCAAIIVAVIPGAISASGVTGPKTVGLVANDLYQLFDALPQLTDWLVLYLAALAVLLLPAVPGGRAAAREIAIPILMMLLYWNDIWFYLPVTMAAGYFLIRWLLLPARLADASRAARSPWAAIRVALAGWRSAEFAGAQRTALSSGSTDFLKSALLDKEWAKYQEQVDTVDRAQQELGARQDRYQLVARTAARTAFSYAGSPLHWQAGLIGALTGGILGLIPTAINLSTSPPLFDSGSYPLLTFLGSTAWNLEWVGIGWFIGYFLPLLRGSTGTGKGMWLFLVAAIAPLPNALVWNDGGDWINALVINLELLVVLVLAVVIIGDIRAVQRAGFRPTDWIRIYNWRFVATWTTALAAAIGTIAITVATATITDLSQQQFTKPSPSGQSSCSSQSTSSSPSSGRTSGTC